MSKEGFCRGNNITLSDNPTVSTIPQDSAQVKEIESALALTELPILATVSYCYYYQVLDDIIVIC
jgi:hypothetical protein